MRIYGFILICAFGHAVCALPLEKLNLPAGFKVAVLAKVPDARSLTVTADDTIFVGNRRGDKVYRVQYHPKKPAEVSVFAAGMIMPNGISLYKNYLYIAQNSKIERYDLSKAHPKPELILDKLPTAFHHGWRYLAFGPDDKMYFSIGAPCNVCVSEDPRMATIMRCSPAGKQCEIIAAGVRNSVGFTWHPETKALWFTDNGRDWLDDNTPPDELNVAAKPNQHFGFPFVYGDNIPDPTYGKLKKLQTFVPPALKFEAHVAALGIHFYTGRQWPKNYRNQAFVAQHGSWNRTKKSGYRIMQIIAKNGKPASKKTFIDGWLQGQEAWGRPVDIATLSDGSMIISDDYAEVVYRVSYQGQ